MSIPSDIRVQVGGADVAAPFIDDVCALYDSVFSQPPFFWRDDESDLHRGRLERLLKNPTFGVALAWHGQRLIGFAYGFSLSADTQRWKSLAEPVAPEIAEEWPGRTFVLFDFAVEASHRGHRVGRRLHDGLLRSRGEDRATLTVQPAAVETEAIYERWGWHKIGKMDGGPTDAAPVFDVYLRALHQGPAGVSDQPRSSSRFDRGDDCGEAPPLE